MMQIHLTSEMPHTALDWAVTIVAGLIAGIIITGIIITVIKTSEGRSCDDEEEHFPCCPQCGNNPNSL